MKKLVKVFSAVLVTLVVATGAPAGAYELQSIKGTEGPDTRMVDAKGTEGPDTRVQPIKGTEGPDTRHQESKGTEGPDVR